MAPVASVKQRSSCTLFTLRGAAHVLFGMLICGSALISMSYSSYHSKRAATSRSTTRRSLSDVETNSIASFHSKSDLSDPHHALELGGSKTPGRASTGRRALLGDEHSSQSKGEGEKEPSRAEGQNTKSTAGISTTAPPAMTLVSSSASPISAISNTSTSSSDIAAKGPYDWFAKTTLDWQNGPILGGKCNISVKDPCMLPPPPYDKRPGKDQKGHMNMLKFKEEMTRHFRRISALLNNLTAVRAALKQTLENLDSSRPVVVIAVNEGFMVLFENFLESCRRANVDIKRSLVLFPSSKTLHKRLQDMGLVSFWSDEVTVKEISSSAARNFYDETFLDMMWLKTLSVWLVLDSGRDLIFQDADVMWLKDPVPYLRDELSVHEGSDSDALFQADGSHAERFAPYYACSGFFFLKSNPRSKEFWTALLFDWLTWLWKSQQAPMNLYLAKSCRIGLRVNVLCENVFVNGRVLIELQKGKVKWDSLFPVIVHVNWTLSIKEKIERLKALGLWFIGEESAGIDQQPSISSSVATVG